MPSVPLESTGDGSICCGYGLGGGASESVGAEELQYAPYSISINIWLHVGCDSWRTNRLLCVLPFEKVLNRAGELGESEYGLNADASEPPVGEGMGIIGLFKAIVYQHSGMS